MRHYSRAEVLGLYLTGLGLGMLLADTIGKIDARLRTEKVLSILRAAGASLTAAVPADPEPGQED